MIRTVAILLTYFVSSKETSCQQTGGYCSPLCCVTGYIEVSEGYTIQAPNKQTLNDESLILFQCQQSITLREAQKIKIKSFC